MTRPLSSTIAMPKVLGEYEAGKANLCAWWPEWVSISGMAWKMTLPVWLSAIHNLACTYSAVARCTPRISNTRFPKLDFGSIGTLCTTHQSPILAPSGGRASLNRMTSLGFPHMAAVNGWIAIRNATTPIAPIMSPPQSHHPISAIPRCYHGIRRKYISPNSWSWSRPLQTRRCGRS